MSVKVSCPACGGPINFPVGSAIVAVCPYCRSVVARGDRQPEDLGKVAALVETDSLLEVGRKGRYQGVPFELTGRAQLAHPAGGVWDEWYAAFADGRWGWLAEAQGRFYLTFEQVVPLEGLPLFQQLALGGNVHLPGSQAALTVAEKAEAHTVSAEGAIPYRLVPGSSYRYADLSGPAGEFATLDYTDTPPDVFVGREVTLDTLGIPESARPRQREARQVEGVHLNCPQCGGALELRAPDKSERVVCPNCGSLLDVNQGQLRFLKALFQPPLRPLLPLGSVGRMNGQDYMTIGFLQRSVRIEGVRYFWEEYLLYHARIGFRWLVCSDHHWSFVEPLSPGKVHASAREATWGTKHFKLFQRARATVEHVLGEFYWKVSVGEAVNATDFIRPPEMLSREVSEAEDDQGEINWSLGTYVPAADIQKAFGLKSLPRPSFGNVAPNQPFLHKRVYLNWGLLTAAAFVLLLIVLAVSPRRTVYEQTFQVQPGDDPDKPHVEFSEPFALQAHQNVRITARAEVNNSWLDIEGDLIQEEGDLVQPFSVPVSFYQGVEEGEAWQEGSKEGTAYLSALPKGTYRLRLEFVAEHPAAKLGQPGQPPSGPAGQPPPGPQGQPPVQPGQSPAKPKPLQPATIPVSVRVEQGVPRLWMWVLTLLALAVIPAGVGAYHIYFELRRWQESSFSPFHSQPVKAKSGRRRVDALRD
jgi:hypothetical protein